MKLLTEPSRQINEKLHGLRFRKMKERRNGQNGVNKARQMWCSGTPLERERPLNSVNATGLSDKRTENGPLHSVL